MRLPAFLAAAVALTAPMPAQGISLPPADLSPGQSYRVLCVTETTTAATSSNIATYNAFVEADVLANPQLAALGTSWAAIGSTLTVSARANTDTDPTPPGATGVPIYRPDGVRLADHYDDLWDASLAAPPNVTSAGTVPGAGDQGLHGNQLGRDRSVPPRILDLDPRQHPQHELLLGREWWLAGSRPAPDVCDVRGRHRPRNRCLRPRTCRPVTRTASWS